MVATKLSEVTAKGMEFFHSNCNGTPAAEQRKESTETAQPSLSVVDQCIHYASTKLQSGMQYAVHQTSSTVADVMKTIYTNNQSHGERHCNSPSTRTVREQKINQQGSRKDPIIMTSNRIRPAFKYPELEWMLQNPYTSVRGRHSCPSSLNAVRSLLTLLPVIQEQTLVNDLKANNAENVDPLSESIEWHLQASTRAKDTKSSNSETASQLAEGTIRALRDLALDEAIELHDALQFWTSRWERPLLSWLEAGPGVWMSPTGYNHHLVGLRVSQIQAVLARRCAAIGELQQHLLRAAWQKGVAQWGVLGQGGQWAAVAGFDGAMGDEPMAPKLSPSSLSSSSSSSHTGTRRLSSDIDRLCRPAPPSPHVGLMRAESIQSVVDTDPNSSFYYGHAHVSVRRTDGGEIMTDDPALAAWSVDAMRIIRGQLLRAGNGLIPLPQIENWTNDSSADELIGGNLNNCDQAFPKWASCPSTIVEEGDDLSEYLHEPARVTISDLPLMASEVSDLLNSMEVIMNVQRNRRLDKLTPQSAFRRNWYMTATGAPVSFYIVYKLLKNGYGLHLARFIKDKFLEFYHEHVSGPLRAIVAELFTRNGRESISDHKARAEAIGACKKMIRSWLDECYPDMDVDERAMRAENMDMSLIEFKKEENMKTFYEINSVVRMSIIEMQFIKKEMMNAMYAMDEMLKSNEINMNLAAVTPAFLIAYGARSVYRFCVYVLFKLGKSREDTFASFRHVVLDIERLLVMRDNPPAAPPPLGTANLEKIMVPTPGPKVLNSDDLGMLMLHLHECRVILWQDRQRFSPQILRDVAEDLAELAGERGAVSVKQQLQIISRMCRTYPFLKVVSTGVPFDFSRTSNGNL